MINTAEGASFLLKEGIITYKEYKEILIKGLKEKHIKLIVELYAKGKR